MDSSLDEIKSELSLITKRLAILEQRIFGASIPASPSPAPAKAPKPEEERIVYPVDMPPTERGEPIGGKLLAGAAVLCFLLAAVFLIRLAVDNGWLTPVRQLGLAALFGGSLIGAGFAFRESDAPYASILPGAGVTILWACVYAGHLGLEVFSEPTTIVMVLFLCGLSLSLFHAFKQAYFLLVMVVGAYTMPAFLDIGLAPGKKDQLYFFIWDILFCTLAIRLGSRGLITLSAYFALVLFYLMNMVARTKLPHSDLSLAAFQFIQFVVFGAFTVRYSLVYKRPLTEREAWFIAPALLLFYVSEYVFIHEIAPSAAPYIALMFAAVLFSVQRSAQTLLHAASLASGIIVAAMVSIVLFHALYIELLSPGAQAWLAIILLAAWPAVQQAGLRVERHLVPILAYWLVIAIEFFRSFQALDNRTVTFSQLILSFAYAALLLVAYFQAGATKRKLSDFAAFMLLSGATAQAFLAADRVSHAITSGPSSDLLMSALAAGYAFGLMALARKFGDRFAANASLVAFLLVSLKVLAKDLDSSAPVVKILTLVVVGGLLYGGGLISRQIHPERRAGDA